MLRHCDTIDCHMLKKKKQWILGESEGRRGTRHQGGEWATKVVHVGDVAICSDQPVCDRCVVFGFVTRWKEGFVNILNRNEITVFWGMRESAVWGLRLQ